ncbi:hypothetical protein ACFL2M_02415, partial [Patescibacteria group bacterium]
MKEASGQSKLKAALLMDSEFFKRNEKWFLWGLLGVFVIFSIVLNLNHEPWRDEAQAWLIARDVPNLLELFRLAGYEG